MERKELLKLLALSAAGTLLALAVLFVFLFLYARSRKIKVEAYESSEELRESLYKKPDIRFGADHPGAITIGVDPNIAYQEIDGFGASLTDCSAWLIDRLDAPQRNDLMEKLFDPQKGIGLSF